ncbi:Uncharacterised protein [Mycobacteroides abscessus subsp. abscessus]|nr:Uncharacterised protein [Mycobacteroides abscessus subsp. abscessus]
MSSSLLYSSNGRVTGLGSSDGPCTYAVKTPSLITPSATAAAICDWTMLAIRYGMTDAGSYWGRSDLVHSLSIVTTTEGSRSRLACEFPVESTNVKKLSSAC